jgi:hypothetical protein
MTLWSIVIPEETTNLVANPKLERVTTGYTAIAGAIARVLTYQKFGQASLRVTPGAAVNDGAYYGVINLAIGSTYTASVYLRGVAGIPYRIYFGSTAGAVLGTPYEFVASGQWQRVWVTYTETATNDRRIYMTKDGHASTDPFYIDALQVEEKEYPTTYCDGDQDGCEWIGQPDLSTSHRLGQVSIGGREVDIESLGLRIENYSGIGMPPSKHIVQGQAQQPGARFRGRKILPRVIQLRQNTPVQNDIEMHALRDELIEAVKPDRQAEDREFILYYYGANPDRPVAFRAVYDSGLDFFDPELSVEYINLRVIAYDPNVTEDGEVSTQLEVLTTLGSPPGTLANVIARIDNEWMILGTSGFDGSVTGAAECIDGRIVFVGYFTDAGGVAANRVALYDRTTDTFAALGVGLNAAADAVTVAPNGDIYVCGAFTLDGGGVETLSRLARWPWGGAAWEGVAGGANNEVRDLIFGPDGSLFITGDFTSVGTGGGIVAADRIARLLPDGTTWEAMGTGLGSGSGETLQIRDFGIVNGEPMFVVFVGGSFTDAGGSGARSVSAYGYGMPTGWWGMGGGTDGFVRRIYLDKFKNLYIAGGFSTAGSIAADNIAYWYGGVGANKWRNVGEGLDYPGDLVGEYDEEGNLFIAEEPQLPAAPALYLWNGSSLIPNPIRMSGISEMNDVLCSKGDLFICSNGDTALVPALTVVDNIGSASARPTIVIRREGGDSLELRGIYNQTTGDRLYMAYNLLDGETLTIHLDDINKRIISSFYGDVPHAILRGSNHGRWRLLPGENDINVFVAEEGSPTIDAYMIYTPTHWSADGVAE